MRGFRQVISSLGAISALAICASHAAAAPGDLDPAFSSDGVAFAKGGVPRDAGPLSPIAVQADGRIVAVAGGPRLIRYQPDGTVDGSFGDHGIARLDLDVRPVSVAFNDLATYPGGRTIAAVHAAESKYKFHDYIVRLTTKGNADPTFGQHGVVKTDLAGPEGSRSLAVEPSGEILVANGDGSILRLRPNGRVDAGYSPTVPSGSTFETPAVSHDGRIFVGVGGASGLTRLTETGQIDSSFGDGGLASICCAPLGGANTIAEIAFAPDGTAYAQEGACMGFTGPGGGTACDGRLARVVPDGQVDPDFGSGYGSNPINVNAGPDPAGLAVDSEGRILAASNRQPFERASVARILPTGQLDGTFGTEGISSAFPAGCNFSPYDLAVAPDGGILLSGTGCRHRMVVKLKSAAGPQDADADGFATGSDGCPEFASSVRSGCPLVERDVHVFKLSGNGVSGELAIARNGPGLSGIGKASESECLGGRRVLLIRVLAPHKRSIIGRVRTTRANFFWRFKRTLPKGRYVVAVPGGAARPRGYCANARAIVDLEHPRSE